MHRRIPRPTIIITVLVLIAAAATWALLHWRSPVSLTVLDCTTNRWSGGLATELGGHSHICATIAVTNKGSQVFTYWARGSCVDYEVLREGRHGWEAPGLLRCGVGLQQQTLAPGQGIVFEAVGECDKRWKVEFTYSDGRKPNRLWERLPSWLTERLPWASPWRTATTDPIGDPSI
jgi:hypothetical protein